MTIRDMGQNAKLYGILIFTHHARRSGSTRAAHPHDALDREAYVRSGMCSRMTS